MKRMNKKIKIYLRKYVNYYQDDWPEYLSMLEFAQNTRKPEKRTYILYQIVYGETSAVTAIKRMKETQSLERAQKDMWEKTRGYPASEYQKDDWIYLRRKRGHKDRPFRFLDHK